MPQYPIPKPEFLNRLKNNPLLTHPDQQAALEQYATGEIGVEATLASILADARARGPVLQKERDATTAERARRVRVQREMALNETAAGPTFVDCDEEGNPLAGSAAGGGDEDNAGESGNSGTDHSNGDQELDQDLDGDLNQQEEELDEFGQPLRAAEAEQSEWDEQP